MAFSFLLIVLGVQAQNYPDEDFKFARIRPYNIATRFLHVEDGPLKATEIPEGSWSADWYFVPVEGTNFVNIVNRWKGTYLNIEHGHLSADPDAAGWYSAQWQIEDIPSSLFSAIKNRWKNAYLVYDYNTFETKVTDEKGDATFWKIQFAQGKPYISLNYDSAAGTGTFYNQYNQQLAHYGGWRSDWTSIVYGGYHNNKEVFYLFYDRNADDIEVYTIDMSGVMSLKTSYSVNRKLQGVTWHNGPDKKKSYVKFIYPDDSFQIYSVDNLGELSPLR